jgi:hypothetical protein
MVQRGRRSDGVKPRRRRTSAVALVLALITACTVAGCARTAAPPAPPAPPVLDGAALTYAARHLNEDLVLKDQEFNAKPCDGVRVHSPQALVDILGQEDFHGCIIIPGSEQPFNMSGYANIQLHSGVWLVGEGGGFRPTLYTEWCDKKHPERCKGYSLFEIRGNDVRVEGLHFEGPAKGSRDSTQPHVNAISVIANADPNPELQLGRNVVIANSEFNEWTDTAVAVGSTRAKAVPSEYPEEWPRFSPDDAGLIRIERNFIHHNAMDNFGYGVGVGSGAYATIEGNVFDFNRHAVASDGYAHSGYVARFNYILSGGFKEGCCYNQHFDVHGTGAGHYGGTAGEFYEIAFNTFRGDQRYSCFAFWCKTRPAFELRGAPTCRPNSTPPCIGADFHDNVAVHENLDAAVLLKLGGIFIPGTGEDHDKFHFHASGNQFKTDHSSELATGDFDGDGRADVFVANGTAWFYSRGGSEPWQFLHASNKRTSELGFADIDNDGATDVLYGDGDGDVGYLKSGVVALVPLTTSPVPMKDMRFGDFDGDGKTDIFYTLGGRWHVWYGSTRMWTVPGGSSFPISALRFGEFDPVRGTDVVAVTSGMWAYSSAATGRWTKLNDQLKSSFAGAVVADFDGDGKSDIAFDEGHQRWSYSPGGRLPLRSLREGDGMTYPALTTLLVGSFDGGPRAEVLSFYQPNRGSVDLTDHFVIWRGEGFSKRSSYPMR